VGSFTTQAKSMGCLRAFTLRQHLPMGPDGVVWAEVAGQSSSMVTVA
jgi:hypothetical protein